MLTPADVALGFLAVADEAMCRPIRALTEARGYDLASHTLACFGAAGGQHACAVASALGIATVHVHRFSGVLSAYGIGLADVVEERQVPANKVLRSRAALADLTAKAGAVAADLTNALRSRGFSDGSQTHSQSPSQSQSQSQSQTGESETQGQGEIRVEHYAGLRYEGTDTCIMVRVTDAARRAVLAHAAAAGVNVAAIAHDDNAAATSAAAADVDGDADASETGPVVAAARLLETAFLRQYKREFGFTLQRPVLLDSLRVRAVGVHEAVVAAIEDSDDEADSDDDDDDDGSESASKPAVRAKRSGSGFPAVAPALPAPIDTVACYFPVSASSHGQSGSQGDGAASENAITGRVTLGVTDVSDVNSATTPANAIALPAAGVQGRWHATPVFRFADCAYGAQVVGPAIIVDETATVVVDLGWRARIGRDGLVIKTVASHSSKAGANTASSASASSSGSSTTEDETISSAAQAQTRYPCDPIRLSVFAHRFMSVAEQMGRALQRTAVSTNIKERLDFSCALFGPDGGLVANAPHLPVHLGAMQEAVRSQIRLLAGAWRDGDVLMSNHPQAGGSHLPDITVITPVFARRGDRAPSFFVASRGHHADIGGITPGSMPPFSKFLYQEGAAVMSLKLVDAGGPFRADAVKEALEAPAGYARRTADEPLCSGTRNLADNLSDLRAQVAANHKGVQLMRGLVALYTLPVVQAYMHHIQAAAEEAVREMLREFATTNTANANTDADAANSSASKATVSAEDGLVRFPPVVDYMDDGTPIALALTVDPVRGEATFDFTGTGPQVYGNTNAPRAVALSAVIYCLRCLVKRGIPLNQGCLNPVRVVIPPGTLLNPSADAAVVGGNVLTSQRVTDVVFKAFNACAASQGCMNNLTFGDDSFGYYETIAGGAGAGPGWAGTSGVHTHMTNTRITDVEIVERRYPVVVRRFGLRAGSGGTGAFPGGDGIVRDLLFLRPLSVNILSERRALRPWGANGGGDAKPGLNHVLRGVGVRGLGRAPPAKTTAGAAAGEIASSSEADGESAVVITLGGKNTYISEAGDALRVLTPGGGGWGKPGSRAAAEAGEASGAKQQMTVGSLAQYTQMQESA